MEKVLVSIHCPAYNHENYIADAIDSFIMQQTDFKYEILIHDDASTDRTAEIIKKYEKEYPELIKPIYQTENQKSKGISITQLNLQRAKGKYIAICEGDDYWVDPQKLQKQIAYMENNPQCSLCVHAGYVVTATEKKLESYNRPNKGDKIYTVEDVIEGDGGLFITNSMMFLTGFGLNRPNFFEVAPVGDYPLAINLSLLGKVYYMDEFMSAYRVGVNGSWTARNLSNIEKRNKHFDRIALMLDELNEYTNYQYSDVIKKTKSYNRFNLLFEQRKYKEAKTGEFREFYKKLGYKRKVIILINQYLPDVSNTLKYFKRIWLKWAMK
ncbi:glycosyltransferase family 2 protein [Solibacillus cecembensis]|uniref:glycosyltransferase family 2 protein n=1 Tax=Solibacillus cecembensis TaxID=459347 RepID=UPI003D07E621